MQRLISLKQLLFTIMLLCLSWTAFGLPTNPPIKPVKRYVDGKDTFTVFTIQNERQIVVQLQAGKSEKEICGIQAQRILLLNRDKNNIDSIVNIDSVEITNYKAEIGLKNKMLSGDSSIIFNENLQYNLEEKRAKRFKIQRNLSAVISIILAVLLIVK